MKTMGDNSIRRDLSVTGTILPYDLGTDVGECLTSSTTSSFNTLFLAPSNVDMVIVGGSTNCHNRNKGK